MKNDAWTKWGLRTLLILIWGAIATILTLHYNQITANAEKINCNTQLVITKSAEMQEKVNCVVMDIKDDISNIKVVQERNKTLLENILKEVKR